LVVGRRLTALVATVIIAPTLAYVVFGALAGTLGQSAPAAARDYVVRTFWHGDFGFSQRFNGSMRDVIAWTLPVDLTMVVGSLVLGMALGVAGGLLAASRPGTFHSRGLQGLAAVLLCCPPYLLPLMMLVLFAPGIGRIAEIPFLSVPNLYRDEPHGFLGQDFIQTARSKRHQRGPGHAPARAAARAGADRDADRGQCGAGRHERDAGGERLEPPGPLSRAA